jgi:threonine dehydrogenase-like Zn-dependent dehydrogenase
MKALLFERKLGKYAAAAVAGRILPGKGASVGPISLRDVDEPDLPAPGWVRVRPRLSGICGSDLATIDGHSSRYFEPIVSFPFVPGHEVVGDLDDGTRVVLIPILTCIPRGIDPPCGQCSDRQPNCCERIAFGHLEPGLQTGFCESTGGGWSTAFVAHESQLIEVPVELSDEAAVMIEPAACAIHAAKSARQARDIVVLGAGTIGLLTMAALRHLGYSGPLTVSARHPHQRALARALGADTVALPNELSRVVRAQRHSMVVGDQLTGGVSDVLDCIGSAESMQQGLGVLDPGGNLRLVGMPGVTTLDLTPLWHRELHIGGSYAYTLADFAEAIDLVRTADLGRLVTATYPLARYGEAIEHAANAGARGAVKIAFDLRNEKERNR